LSLINEALQKAQAQDAQRSGAAAPLTAAVYQPASTTRRNTAKRGRIVTGVAMFGIVAVLATGGFGLFSARQAVAPQPAAARSIFDEPQPLVKNVPPPATASVPAAPREPKPEAAPPTPVAAAPTAPQPPPVAEPNRPQTIDLFADSVYATRPLPVDTEMPPSKPSAPPEVEAKFDPQTTSIPVVGKIKLNAIVRSPNGARAMINSTIVGVGDNIGPAEVVLIEAKRVKLRVDGKTYSLQMP